MSDNDEKQQLKRGVLVEFDYAILPGHDLLLDVCTKRFAKEGVKADFMLLAKTLYGKSFAAGFNDLFTKLEKTLDVPALVAECQESFTKRLDEAMPKVPASFVPFVKALLEKNIRVAVLSRLEPEKVRTVFDDFESEHLVFQSDTSSGFGFHNCESLRRYTRKSGIYERLTMAVVASGNSAKNALTCGMSVLAKPNAYTEFQDFSGCDLVIDDFATSIIPEILPVLRLA
ncbi:MAG: hypothetical protein J6334_01800 [Kiritimatiellae bacterium]|nr:hypothetical protein [Kiritimatiellia bacterium]